LEKIKPTIKDYSLILTGEKFNAISLHSMYLRIRHLLENYGYMIEQDYEPFSLFGRVRLFDNKYRIKCYINANKTEEKEKYPRNFHFLLEGYLYYDGEKDTEPDSFPIKSELFVTLALTSSKSDKKPNILNEFDEMTNKIQNLLTNLGFTPFEL